MMASLTSPKLLIERIETHLAAVREAAADNEFIDVSEAERIAGLLRDALGEWSCWDERQRQVLADAVAYFVHAEDDEDDLRSPIGFEDDAAVVEAAVRRVMQPKPVGTGSVDPTT